MGEQIGDDQRPEPPGLGIVHTARYRGITAFGIGGAGIEHQKIEHRQRGIPAPCPPIAIVLVRIENGPRPDGIVDLGEAELDGGSPPGSPADQRGKN